MAAMLKYILVVFFWVFVLIHIPYQLVVAPEEKWVVWTYVKVNISETIKLYLANVSKGDTIATVFITSNLTKHKTQVTNMSPS